MQINKELENANDNTFNKMIDNLFEDLPKVAEHFKIGQSFRQEIEKETDRGMVLFGVSRLEVLLKDLLEKRLAGGKK